ncbi:MAG: SH3 domain-containing protein [Rhodospirillaceae bacterium]
MTRWLMPAMLILAIFAIANSLILAARNDHQASLWLIPKVQAQTGRVSSLPIPRFVSLRTDPVNLRTGPGLRYPISWRYQRRYLPVEVEDEFNTWRRIRDVDGAEGWVHQSMLSGQRTGLVIAQSSPLYKGSIPSSAIIAQVSSGVVITIDRCPEQIEFCLVQADSFRGWLRREVFWGLYDGEVID